MDYACMLQIVLVISFPLNTSSFACESPPPPPPPYRRRRRACAYGSAEPYKSCRGARGCRSGFEQQPEHTRPTESASSRLSNHINIIIKDEGRPPPPVPTDRRRRPPDRDRHFQSSHHAGRASACARGLRCGVDARFSCSHSTSYSAF